MAEDQQQEVPLEIIVPKKRKKNILDSPDRNDELSPQLRKNIKGNPLKFFGQKNGLNKNKFSNGQTLNLSHKSPKSNVSRNLTKEIDQKLNKNPHIFVNIKKQFQTKVSTSYSQGSVNISEDEEKNDIVHALRSGQNIQTPINGKVLNRRMTALQK